MTIQSQGGQLDEFPDYVGPEDGQLDPAVIEQRLDALLGPGIDTMRGEGGAFRA